MSNSLKSWLGQITTGHGAMVLSGTVLSVLSGAMTWGTAAPLLVAGAVGMAWPENARLQSAAHAVATDAVDVVAAYGSKGAPPPA